MTVDSLHILIVDDEEIVRQTLGDYLRDSGHRVQVAASGKAAVNVIAAEEFDLALFDVRLPGMDGIALLAKAAELRPSMPVAIITAHGNLESAIQALRLGATDFLLKPVKLLELDAVVEKCLRMGRLLKEKRRLRETIRGLQTPGHLRFGDRGIVGGGAARAKVLEQVRQAVQAGCDTILITGETGTGKEVVAREIHSQAMPPESPFIAVSCPALPESLVESELFGHVKGAFTGAFDHRAGCFELAHGGTLFLDEVGDLSNAAQVKLLRALETRAVRRVGGKEEIRVDIRVVAATNAPLEDRIKAGTFRPDLYYRLNVFSIHLLPLRERREDILPLAEHFLAVYAGGRGLRFDGFAPEVQHLLLNYDYPGNARELRNLVERAAILCRAGMIQPEHLPLLAPAAAAGASPPTVAAGPGTDERGRVLAALVAAKWNRRQAAKALGMPYSTLRYKIQRFDIA